MSVDSNKLLSVDLYALTDEDERRFALEAGLGMIPPSDPLLSEVAEPVSLSNLKLVQKVIVIMETAAVGQRHSRGKLKRRTLVGLAAPQIGIGLRIILVDTRVRSDRKNYGKLQCFINPEIVWRSHETDEGREGCFSAGPVWGLVRRPVAVKIRALTSTGMPIERVFEGFSARIVQHEIDHLNGVRFPDRIRSDRKRHWVHTEEIETYVKQVNRWPRMCTKARWEAVKNGQLLKGSV